MAPENNNSSEQNQVARFERHRIQSDHRRTAPTAMPFDLTTVLPGR
jgi:hypothetical protein